MNKPTKISCLELVLDAALEVNDILADLDARKEIDSFTNQPLILALKNLNNHYPEYQIYTRIDNPDDFYGEP